MTDCADAHTVPRVVFHCTLSQVRGPKAARIYAEELERQARLRARATRATTDAPATTGPPPPPQQQQGNKGKGELPNPYEEEGNEHVETGQEVFVLRDGFQGWQSLYRYVRLSLPWPLLLLPSLPPSQARGSCAGLPSPHSAESEVGVATGVTSTHIRTA